MKTEGPSPSNEIKCRMARPKGETANALRSQAAEREQVKQLVIE